MDQGAIMSNDHAMVIFKVPSIITCTCWKDLCGPNLVEIQDAKDDFIKSWCYQV